MMECMATRRTVQYSAVSYGVLLRCLLGLAVAMFLTMTSGCASIVSGSSQSVSVETNACREATCELRNDKGKWYVTKTPGSVTIQRSYEDLVVSCRKGDETSPTSAYKSTTKGMAFGNILFGGIIGAGVDVASGAAYEYPGIIQVDFACKNDGASVATTSPVPRLGLRVQDYLPQTDTKSAAGVVVTFVHPGSRAEQAGIKPGHVIVACNRQPVRDIDSFDTTLRNAAEAPVLSFDILGQDGTTQAIVVRSAAKDF